MMRTVAVRVGMLNGDQNGALPIFSYERLFVEVGQHCCGPWFHAWSLGRTRGTNMKTTDLILRMCSCRVRYAIAVNGATLLDAPQGSSPVRKRALLYLTLFVS
jgi:hypothetical protein